MKKPILRSARFWTLLFILSILLSQSNLLIDYSSQPGLLGFPQWLWWYILIHALFLIVLYSFIKHYWSEEES